jgi:sensor histidine kinase YesM
VFPTDTILEVHRQSQGLPRLINTLCENALIHGYAKQAHSISPEIIEEIAAEFRLNVVHSLAPEPGMPSANSEEIERAARTLLDLYSHLRNAQDGRTHRKLAVGAGARKNEPHI